MGNLPDHLVCHPDRNSEDRLATPISKDEIEVYINDALERVRAEIAQKFNPNLNFRKNQSNSMRTLEIAQRIKDHVPAAGIQTYGELRKLAHRAHDAVRDGVQKHKRFKDRSIATEIADVIRRELGAGCKVFRERAIPYVQPSGTSTEAADGQEHTGVHTMTAVIDAFPKGALNELQNAKGVNIVSGNERASQANAALFAEFTFLLDETVARFAKEGTPTDVRAAFLKEAQAYCGDDQSKLDLLTVWAKILLTTKIDPKNLPKTNAKLYPVSPSSNGHDSIHTNSDALLMPNKHAHVLERNGDPDGEPDWELTEEELIVLRDVWKVHRQQSALTISPDEDTEFLQKAADFVNKRCNGSLQLVRATREIWKAVNELEAIHAASADTVPAGQQRNTAQATEKAPSADAPSVAPVSTQHVTAAIESPEEMVSFLKQPPVAELCNRALRALSEIVQTDIRKGDQVIRAFLQELHAFLSARNQVLWDAPRQTTAFDEVAVQFLLAMTSERAPHPLIRYNPGQHSVVFSQDFSDHSAAAALIITDWSERLPTPGSEERIRLHPADARRLSKRCKVVNEIIRPMYVKLGETSSPAAITSNKYISQALLLQCADVLIETEASLKDFNQLPEGISEPALESYLVFAESCCAAYELDLEKQELKSRVPSPDHEEIVKKLFQRLKDIFDEHGTRILPTHNPQTGITVSAGEEFDALGAAAELSMNGEKLRADHTALQNRIAEKLSTSYKAIHAFSLQLQSIHFAAPGDEDLHMLSERVKQAADSLLQYFPQNTYSGEGITAAKVSLLQIQAEADRLVALAQESLQTIANECAERDRIAAELNQLETQLASLQRIDALQKALHEEMAQLQAHQRPEEQS